jgi:hypothetical protein
MHGHTRVAMLVFCVVFATTARISSPLEIAESRYQNALVMWQSAEPSCFDPKLPFPEQFEGVPLYGSSSHFTEPRLVKSEELPEDLLAGERVPIMGVPIFELVVNAAGVVESVVALKPLHPGLEAALTDHCRSFEFEPATLDGNPVCVKYIVTVFITWR